MITLITGTPGAGKTAWMVQELTRLPSQRKVYVHGVPDLKIAHESIYCLSELCDHCRSVTHVVERSVDVDDFGFDSATIEVIEEINKPGIDALLVEQWPDWSTPGSLIVIDEVQRVWRPTGSKLPDEVAALETHRHKGLDFWLISQGPHLFHSNIRLLVGRHIHLVSTWLSRKEYEFAECRQNTSSRQDAVVRPYSLPKKVFGLYKSSSLHTKITHRKPMTLYALGLVLLLASYTGYGVYSRFNQRFNHESIQAEEGAKAQATATPSAPNFSSSVNIGEKQSTLPDFKPVIEGVPESAPAYSHLVKVTQVPLLAGCVESKKTGCKCFTSQATPYPATDAYCNEVLRGRRFNPYLQADKFSNISNDDNQELIGVDKKAGSTVL